MTPTITARQREYALAYIAAEPRAVTAARFGVRISSVDNTSQMHWLRAMRPKQPVPIQAYG
jgi:hypothetical protein